MLAFLQALVDPIALVKAAGLLGVLIAVFAESGLFFGFFLPGDSLLFTAGLLASQGLFPIAALVVGTAVAAVAGDSVGYWFGKKTGEKIFSREDSRFFKKKHVESAHAFFLEHGPKAVVLARFIPVVRTFVPIVAGVGTMPYRSFISYNVLGGVGWTALVSLAGYFLGSAIPGVDSYLLPIVAVIIVVSFIPVFSEYRRARKRDGGAAGR